MLKKIFGFTFILAVILISGCISSTDEPEPVETNHLLTTSDLAYETMYIFISINWTDELIDIYNESEKIEVLKYNQLLTLNINNKSKRVHKIIVAIIPDDMESRGCFKSETETIITYDKTVLIGDNSVTNNYETTSAYVFTNINVSKKLCELDNQYYRLCMSNGYLDFVYIDLREGEQP